MAITNIYFKIPVGLFNGFKNLVVENILERINTLGTHGWIKLPETVVVVPPPLGSMPQFNYDEATTELKLPEWAGPDDPLP